MYFRYFMKFIPLLALISKIQDSYAQTFYMKIHLLDLEMETFLQFVHMGRTHNHGMFSMFQDECHSLVGTLPILHFIQAEESIYLFQLSPSDLHLFRVSNSSSVNSIFIDGMID